MAQKHVVLRADQHAETRVAETTDWRFAAKDIFLPVDVSELPAVAREYPIFFAKDKAGIFALTGVETGVNAYVGENGQWLSEYIPNRLRVYPFTLAKNSGSEGSFSLAARSDAPEWNAPKGNRLFINGVATDFVKKRSQLISRVRKAGTVTEKHVQQIKKLDLLENAALNVRFLNGGVQQVVGLQCVSEKKLAALSDADFLSLRKSGALSMVYAHLLSLGNITRGPLAERYPGLKEQPAANNAASDIVELD